MGWIFSMGLLIVYLQNRTHVDPDVILLTSGLFAVAGGLGSISSKIGLIINKLDK